MTVTTITQKNVTHMRLATRTRGDDYEVYDSKNIDDDEGRWRGRSVLQGCRGAGARRAEKREQLQDQVQQNQQRINYDFVLLCIIRLDQCLSNINIWRTLKKILCSKFFHCVARRLRDSGEIMEIVHQGMCNCMHNPI